MNTVNPNHNSNTGNGCDKARKLEALREKLFLGEKSPLVENFDIEVFLAELHEKYSQTESARENDT